MRGGFREKLAAFSEGATGRQHPLLQQQRLAALGDIMAADVPNEEKVNQLWRLGTPEAADIALKFSSAAGQVPQTTGLPEGYMWQNGQAVQIPGIGLRPQAPLSPEAKLSADYRAGLIDEDTYKRAMAKQVAPVDKNYKEFQLQAASFADRMNKAEEILQPIEQSGSDTVNEAARTAAAIPSLGLGEFIGNKMLSPQQQVYRNAASEWIRSKLRKESGAAIGDNEMAAEYRTYFPMAGDSPEVIKQKAALRKSNTVSMMKQAGGAYEDQYGDGSQNTSPNESFSTMPYEDVPPEIQRNMGNIRVLPENGGTPNKVLVFDKNGNLVQ